MRLALPRVALVGGLFENQPEYLQRFQRALRKYSPRAESFRLTVPGVFGAARLAGLEKLPVGSGRSPGDEGDATRVLSTSSHGVRRLPADPARLAAFAAASTEQRNPRSRRLDKRSIPDLVDLFIKEERHVEKALAAQRGPIAKAATLVAKKLSKGGRLFYIGAGTSGRLGVVDASEMPPTFNAPPEQVQAIIAGGAAAVFRSQEGAEDARDTGVAELRSRRLTQARCCLRHCGERADAVRARRARLRAGPGCGDDPADVQSEAVDSRAGRRGDRSSHRAGDRDRLDAAEGGHGDKAGFEYAEHDRDGAVGPGAG